MGRISQTFIIQMLSEGALCFSNSAYFYLQCENRLNLLKFYRNERRALFEKTFKEGYWKTMEVQIINEILT